MRFNLKKNQIIKDMTKNQWMNPKVTRTKIPMNQTITDSQKYLKINRMNLKKIKKMFKLEIIMNSQHGVLATQPGETTRERYHNSTLSIEMTDL